MKRFAAAAALVFAVFSSGAYAQETPAQLKGGRVITADEAKKLLDSKGTAFVDTRSVVNFGKGHVPGAVTVSYKEKSEKAVDFDGSKDEFDFSKLPADKSARIVFYSDGPTGWKSYKAAVLAVQRGYGNVMYLRGGFAEWGEKGYAVER